MEKEKLLKQAKFLYPVGTKYISTCKGSNGRGAKLEIKKNRFYIEKPDKCSYNALWNPSGYGFIWDNKNNEPKWAEVISRPDQYVKVIDSDTCYSSHKLTTSRSQPKENKTYKVKDRVIFGIENPYGTYVIEANNQVFVIGHEGVIPSSKIQFDQDWNSISDEVKFEIGKWYYFDENKYALRCSKLNSTRFAYNQFIKFNEQLHDYSNNSYSYDSLSLTNKEVSLESIQQYLPDGHEDKFITKQTPMKKKDIVVVHVPHIEMYDFVKDNSRIDFNNYNAYKEETCLNLTTRQYASMSFFTGAGFQVTSFTDWLKQTDNESKWQEYLFELAKKKYPIGCTITDMYGDTIVFDEKVTLNCPASPRNPLCLVLFFLKDKNKSILIYSSSGKWTEFTEPVVKKYTADDYKRVSDEMSKLYASTPTMLWGTGGTPSVDFSHISLTGGNPFLIEESETRSLKWKVRGEKREYYIPRKEVKEVKQLVLIPRKRSKSINKY